MSKFRVFISSVQKEFAAERKALYEYLKTDALLSSFFEPILFEKFPAARAGYIERFGTGTLEIIRLSKAAHLNAPDFNVDEGFKLVLWRPIDKDKPTHRKSKAGAGVATDHDTDLDLRHSPNFRDNYLEPAMKEGYIEITLPDKPQSRKQQYRLTKKGRQLQKSMQSHGKHH